ncbi:MAG TPA: Hint domain-containing protein [Puia sp.]|nr:Hint domain-containing protein [Puia sp.]
MKYFFAAAVLMAVTTLVRAQDTTKRRALTMEEYEKARTFSVGDPDKDTYVKFENAYILDHNGFGKPYFITGDDSKRKRIDLYRLIRKEDRTEIGTVIYYTTENGKRYTVCMPGYRADPAVWNKYFEDIHAIEKQEPFFVLKLSYVLSKELGYQLYQSAGAGRAAVDRSESGTYGNDICFPGDMEVTMEGGERRLLKDVRPGDAVVTVDPLTHRERVVRVKALTVHAVKNYAITRLVLVSAVEKKDRVVRLSSRVLEATPNHPMGNGRTAGELKIGDRVWCAGSDGYRPFTVWDKTETAGGPQRVYNIVAAGGSTLVLNGVLVMQK